MWHEPGGATWEPVFVARPGARSEDDGVVVCTIMQPDGKSALLVLDARTWKEVARAVVPYAVCAAQRLPWWVVGAPGAPRLEGSSMAASNHTPPGLVPCCPHPVTSGCLPFSTGCWVAA